MVRIFNTAKYSNVINHLEEIKPKNKCCEIEYNKIANKNVQVVCRQTAENKLLWLLERQFRITGSRCYGLYTYKNDDWSSKAKKYFWPKNYNLAIKKYDYCQSRYIFILILLKFSSKYIRHGIESEEEARECFKRKTNFDIIQTGLIICEKQPWLAYSPDGIIMKDGEPYRLLEIKCPFAGSIFILNFNLTFKSTILHVYLLFQEKQSPLQNCSVSVNILFWKVMQLH